MSTALGLGLFVFVLRFFSVAASLKIYSINAIIIACLYYRGLLTFSRGGMLTGMIIIAVLLLFIVVRQQKKAEVRWKLGLLFVLFPMVFAFASYQTNGLLFKRYNNQNPNGKYKTYETNGRQDIAMEEIQIFKNNPVMGIGVGKTKEVRKLENGSHISTHNEMTRLLAEHGIFGLFSILILVFTPLMLYLKNRQNFYLFCFFFFWLLTISHSGMRVAAPSFIYALALTSLKMRDEVNSV
jgi:hypothetical protein